MTTANLRPIDHKRAGRLLLGWLRGDKLAIDTAMDEATDDPAGGVGILLAATALSAELVQLIAPEDAEQQIERALLRLAAADGENGDTPNGEG